ncbi:MAG: DNA cytosine methyltransferase [Candidatus Puniceispirillaceae bacterium]
MKIIDLFAGCGGLTIGFHREGFQSVSFLEWDEACINTLKANFQKDEQEPLFLQKDIRFFESYLPNLVEAVQAADGIDGIIGGPPCQAYSMAGRVRDPNSMKTDYRNFLFESYCEILKALKPRFFVFENVPGILSAKPYGQNILIDIAKGFASAGYECGTIDKNIVYDFADFGGPQKRKRIIIFGVHHTVRDATHIVSDFHKMMTKKKTFKPSTVYNAIGDLPEVMPHQDPSQRRISHISHSDDPMHQPRFHSERDMNIFRLLATDAKSNDPKYQSTESLKKLYFDMVGKESNVHKYHVLRQDQPSNLIPAHLYKDGLRHIHPDPDQARSITPREAARLQSFPDDYQFVGSKSDIYKMIGNAVAPDFSKIIAQTIKEIMPLSN